MVTTKDDIVDKLRAPYGRLTRAMREDAACEIIRLRAVLKQIAETYNKPTTSKDGLAFMAAAALKETGDE